MAKEFRVGDVVYRDGFGYSEIAPQSEFEKAISKSKTSGGGGGGSSSRSSAASRAEAAKLEAEVAARQSAEKAAAQAEAQRIKEEQQRQAALDKALRERTELALAARRREIKTSKDISNNEQIQIETIKSGAQKIKTITRPSGETTIQYYGTGKGGGGQKLQKSVSFQAQPKQESITQIKREPETFVITGEVQPARQPVGILEKTSSFLKELRIKGTEREIQKAKPLEKIKLAGGAFLAGVSLPIVDTISLSKSAITSPKETGINLYSGIKETGSKFLFSKESPFPEIGRTIREEPIFTAGAITGEVVSAKLIGISSKKLSEATKLTTTRLSPSYTAVTKIDNIDIIKVPSKITGEITEIKLAGSIGSKTLPRESISQQVKISGKIVDAASAQRGLFGSFKKKIVVEKPLPTPTSPELERAFFADPKSRIRPSRLGITEQPSYAGIKDILLGEEIVFKKPKPQALIFENVQVEKFPSKLVDIRKSLLSGKTLTTSQEKRFLEFQLTPSGKFKPVGFLSQEPEITLAPGEIIKGKKIAKTIIDNKPVEIYRAEIEKPLKKPTTLITENYLENIKQIKSYEPTSIKVIQPSQIISTLPITGKTTLSFKDYKPQTSYSIETIKPSYVSSTIKKEELFSKPYKSKELSYSIPPSSPTKQQYNKFSSPINSQSIFPSPSQIYKPSPVTKTPVSTESLVKTYRQNIIKPTPIPETKIQLKNKIYYTTAKKPSSLYNVQIRRGGKFFSIGSYKNLRQAVGVGAEKVGSTLAATFKVTGEKLNLKTPKGFYKKISKKEGTVFIEKRKKRLSRIGEKKEIQAAKKRKKRSRK